MRWTEAEDAMLRHYVGRGVSLRSIARFMDLSVAAVRKRAIAAGLHEPTRMPDIRPADNRMPVVPVLETFAAIDRIRSDRAA